MHPHRQRRATLILLALIGVLTAAEASAVVGRRPRPSAPRAQHAEACGAEAPGFAQSPAALANARAASELLADESVQSIQYRARQHVETHRLDQVVIEARLDRAPPIDVLTVSCDRDDSRVFGEIR